MGDNITEKAIQTLSQQIIVAASHAISDAPYATFRRATVRKLISEHTYQVSIDDRLIELPVYGDCHFDCGEQVYIISPQNSKNYHDMFILGKAVDLAADSPDHKTLMQVVEEVNKKLNKSAIVQETGQSTANVMSQKAVTDALEELKSAGTIKVIINGNQILPVTTDGTVTIPIASAAHTGVVKSASEENKISVDGEGVMSVNALDLMRVMQHEGDTLILDAGNSAQ